MILGLNFVLWSVALWLLVRTLSAKPSLLPVVSRRIVEQATFIAPRLLVGMMGAGFYAVLVPAETMEAWLGPGSGLTGYALASLAGILTPGGPLVGFAIAAALVGHAGQGQIIAYVTAWSLFALNRTLVWEVPVLGRSFTHARILWSLPVFAGLCLVLALAA